MRKRIWKRIIASYLVVVMVFGLLPISSLHVNAEGGNAPQVDISVEQVKNQGIPVINLDLADPSVYDTLKTVKDKQSIKKFTLYNTDGTVIEVGMTTDKETGKEVYPLTAKGRGNSSWTMPTGKKPYNLKFEKKIDLLGMGKAKSWCLISNWADTSYMRNYMAYQLACEMGMGTPDSRQIALCIDGKFEGIYLLTEKVGINDFRTEIPESAADRDVNGDGIVTEIIIESDSRAVLNNEPGRFATKGDVWFVPKDPDPEDLAATELVEIEKEVNTMETVILSGGNYKDYIDVDSWVDTYIVNELAKNPDFGFGHQPCYSSSYLYFREGGKVYAGPVWDFDIAYGRTNYGDNDAEWNRDTNSPEGYLSGATKYYKELIEKTDFMEYVIARWKEIRANGTLEKWLGEIYTAGYNAVDDLVEEDIAAWGDHTKRISYNVAYGRETMPFQQECNQLRNFITARIAWLDTKWNVDEIDVAYSDGEWTRDKISSVVENPEYADLIREALGNVWDGGYGFIEKEEVTEKELGKAQGEIPPVEVDSMTLQLDTTGVASPVCTMWYTSTDVGTGFGPESSKKQITVTDSGTYVGFVTSGWWVNNGHSYTMNKNNCYVYIVNIGADGSVTVNDGSIYLDGKNPCIIEGVLDTHYGALEKNEGGYVLKYQADGNGNHTAPGTGSAAELTIGVVEGGNTNLIVTKRAEGTRYPDELDSFESTYIEVTSGMPERWENSNPDVVSFDENNRKVTALKAGTATITAKAGEKTSALTFTVTEKQAAELSKTEDPTMGLYASAYKRELAPQKGTWATVAANQMYGFTYTLNLTANQLENANSFYLADAEQNQTLSADGDCYIFVNGKPWLKADEAATNSNMAGDYSANIDFVDKKADLKEANKGLKAFMQEGENTIEILMVSASDSYLDRPYLFGMRRITSEVTPPEPDIEVESITVTPATQELVIGEKTQLKVAYTPENAVNKSVVWTTSDNAVITVYSTGWVTANGVGTAEITATTLNGKTGIATITVTAPPVEDVQVETVTLDVIEEWLEKGTTLQLHATVAPAEAVDKTLTWTSSNESVASVDANGLVTAVGAGETIITANSVNGKKDTACIVVTIPVSSVTIKEGNTHLVYGECLQLRATVAPYNASNKLLTWTSSNEEVATVNRFGVVTAVGDGNATITATTSNGLTDSVEITATVPVTKVIITPAESKLYINESITLTAEIAPLNASDKTLTWRSSNENIAMVDRNGMVTANGVGTATITAMAVNGMTATATISVEAKPTPGKVTLDLTPVSREAFTERTIKEGIAFLNSNNDGLLNYNRTSGVVLKPGESVAFAAKDFNAKEQILSVSGTGTLTFVTSDNVPQVLDVKRDILVLPEITATEYGYTYYLLANTGETNVVLNNLTAETAINWEVSFETLPEMYKLNAQAFGMKDLEISNAKFESDTTAVFNTLGFTLDTSMCVDDLDVKNKFRKDGLHGELTRKTDVLNNCIHWSGLVRPNKLTSTLFTFTALDESGNKCENPVKLRIKVTRK